MPPVEVNNPAHFPKMDNVHMNKHRLPCPYRHDVLNPPARPHLLTEITAIDLVNNFTPPIYNYTC